MLCAKLVEQIGAEKRTVFEAYILPIMREVKFQAGFKNLLNTLVLHFGIGVNDVGKKLLVLIVHKVAHSHDCGHISYLTHNASHRKTNGDVVCALSLKLLFYTLNIHTRASV